MKLHHLIIGPLALISLPGTASESGHHWSYSGGTGPAHWSLLEPDYASCGNGKEQSPVNIETSRVRAADLPPLIFHYRAVPLHVINNGHTIQVNVPAGSTLSVGGHDYALVQFHFHHPSEERIDGKSSDLVAHLVHRDAGGHLAVVAVLLQRGAPSPLLARLWRNLPHEQGHESAPEGVEVDARALLPSGLGYYAFNGSLTTPPCSEGVRWFVLKSPMSLSDDQLAVFAKLYPANARSLQPLNGRVILSTR